MDISLKATTSELTKFALFKDLKPDQIEFLCLNSYSKSHIHKEIVFSFGEPANYFGIVLSGAYKLTRFSPNGEESVIHFSSTGDVVAALIMSQKISVYPLTVKAMGPSRMLILPKKTYVDRWLINPKLIIQIQTLLSTRMSRLQSQKVMQRSPMAAKIASLLMHLAAQDKNTTAELEVPLPLTRREIADALGVTVESVIRVMSEWVKQGCISTTDQHIKILKPEMLIELVERLD